MGSRGQRSSPCWPDGNGVAVLVLQSSSMGFVRRSNTGGPGGIIPATSGLGDHAFDGLTALAKFQAPGLDAMLELWDTTGLKGRYRVNFGCVQRLILSTVALVSSQRTPHLIGKTPG